MYLPSNCGAKNVRTEPPSARLTNVPSSTAGVGGYLNMYSFITFPRWK
jgi:hypothetical protein